MLPLDITQLLCSGIPDELCASCFEKPNIKSGDEGVQGVKGRERKGTERNDSREFKIPMRIFI